MNDTSPMTKDNSERAEGLAERPQVYPDAEGGLAREFCEFAAFISENPPMQQREVSVRMVRAVAARITTLEAENAKLRKALEWYADPISHAPTQLHHPQTAAAGDGGKRARAALEPSHEGENTDG